jgi:hypothetical protein
MSNYTQVELAWLTTAENAAATHPAREPIVDTGTYRLVIHDGSTAGGHPHATEAYVQAQIALLAAGTIQNVVLASSCS